MDSSDTRLAVTIRREDPAQPDVIALLEASEAITATHNPAGSNHHLPLAALREPPIRFLVARDGAGRALGTGALARTLVNAAGLHAR